MVNHAKIRVALVFFLLGLCAAASAGSGSFVCAQESYDFVLKWGTSGSGDGEFNNPDGIDNYDLGIYITDQNNNRVQKFTMTGTFQDSLPGGAPFNHPAGIFGDAGNYILYVADRDNNQIQKLRLNGSLIKAWGSLGSADGQFDHPFGIARMPGIGGDYQSKVYVTDTGNNRIQIFSTNGSTVTFFRKWGSAGSQNGQFDSPRGIAIEKTGFVYVADYNNNRVQKFNPDGTFVTAWGSTGSENGQFNGPYNIAIDQNGAVYVTDSNNNRVQKFDANGGFIGAWGTAGTGDGQFNTPKGIYIYNLGTTTAHVFVVDSGNNRIQKFLVSIGSSGTTTTTTPDNTTTTTTTATTVLCPAQKVLGDDNPELENLRFFRDSTLAKSAVGRKLIKIYYNNADNIDAALDRSPALRACTKKILETIAPMMVGKEE